MFERRTQRRAVGTGANAGLAAVLAVLVLATTALAIAPGASGPPSSAIHPTGGSSQDGRFAPVELRAADRLAITLAPPSELRTPQVTGFGLGEESTPPGRQKRRRGVGAPPSPSAQLVPPTPLPTVSPTPTPSPSATSPAAVAIRVTVSQLDIDLPVVSSELEVAGNEPLYALCDVAQYLTSFSQPGEGGTVYLYAHARKGMFAPLLEQSLKDNGAALLGARVEVDTGDGWTYAYEIDLVKRHALDFSIADELSASEEQVVLHTSEGPSGTIPKLQVAGRLVERLATPTDRLPQPAAPRVCVI